MTANHRPVSGGAGSNPVSSATKEFFNGNVVVDYIAKTVTFHEKTNLFDFPHDLLHCELRFLHILRDMIVFDHSDHWELINPINVCGCILANENIITCAVIGNVITGMKRSFRGRLYIDRKLIHQDTDGFFRYEIEDDSPSTTVECINVYGYSNYNVQLTQGGLIYLPLNIMKNFDNKPKYQRITLRCHTTNEIPVDPEDYVVVKYYPSIMSDEVRWSLGQAKEFLWTNRGMISYRRITKSEYAKYCLDEL